MKKTNLIYIFIIALLSISCSSDDDSSNTSTNAINPPDWIQGTWLQQNGNSTTQNGFKFTSDDFITISSNIQISWKDNVNNSNNVGANTDVNENVNENEYKIDITITSQTVSYYFEKRNDNVIEWTNDPLGDLAETLFIKQ